MMKLKRSKVSVPPNTL